jgi:transcriptional regulator
MSTDAPRPLYPPPAFRETRREVLLDFVDTIGLGQLITRSDGTLHATAAPFVARETAGGLRLECHLQQGNPQWRGVEGEALVLVQGPHAYIHPGWYETKKSGGRVVPTWNYMVVQARGPVTVLEGDTAWLAAHLEALSRAREAGRDRPWSMADAPPDYVEALMGGIVGVSIEVESLEGRWKLSQNHPEANRAGVIAGLETDGGPLERAIAAAMRAAGTADRS